MNSLWCIWFTVIASATHISEARVSSTENAIQTEQSTVSLSNNLLRRWNEFLKKGRLPNAFNTAMQSYSKRDNLSKYALNDRSLSGDNPKSKRALRDRHVSFEKRHDLPEGTNITDILNICKRGRLFNLWFRLMCERFANEIH